MTKEYRIRIVDFRSPLVDKVTEEYINTFVDGRKTRTGARKAANATIESVGAFINLSKDDDRIKKNEIFDTGEIWFITEAFVANAREQYLMGKILADTRLRVAKRKAQAWQNEVERCEDMVLFIENLEKVAPTE